jgi:hypothetical protein
MNEERLYINDELVELSSDNKIVRTLQVNDLARLDNTQTNYTKNIKIPRSPKNIQLLNYLGIIGNNSNFPYERNKAKYFIGNECLIYNGWVTVISTTPLEFELVIYDGNIDFFKAIENTKLSDVGLQDLNHLKNLPNIITTFTATTLPYKYIIADFNGNNTFSNVSINTDYQLPSANVKFIWNQIFDYADFTYSGKIFDNQEFTNLWMTFPKPVPKLVPNLILINKQETFPVGYTVHYYDGYALFERTDYIVSIFRENFSTPEAEITTVGQTTMTSNGDVIPNSRFIKIKQNGVYSINLTGHTGVVNYRIVDASGVNIENGSLDLDPSTSSNTNIITQSKIFNLLVNYKLYVNCSIENLSTARFPFSFNRVDGYQANFVEVLVDFPTKDFVNEVMQRFGLTMQKDKFSNHLSFFTLDEILKSSDVLDWSDKLISKSIEKYKIGNYAQRNNFKYRYNEENDNHNDGYILVNDINLNDEITVIQSKIYSPEFTNEVFFGNSNQVYKFWNREIEKDGTIKYKELTGRYYFMRYDQSNTTVKVGSESLFTEQTVNTIPTANFNNLKFQQIIDKFYPSLKSILDKSKILTCDIFLNDSDVSNFDFKQLVYLKQFGSYYLVNKVSNYVSGQSTKVELIEVDYNKSFTEDIVIGITGTLTIDSIEVTDCLISLNYSTTLPIGTTVNLVGEPWDFGLGLPVFYTDPLYYFNYNIETTGTTGTIDFRTEAGGYYTTRLYANYGTIISNQYQFSNTGCTISSPTAITIINTTLLSTDLFSNTYKVDFTSDAVLPRTVYQSVYGTSFGGFGGGWSTYEGITTSVPSINVTVGTLFGIPTGIKLKIGNTESPIHSI